MDKIGSANIQCDGIGLIEYVYVHDKNLNTSISD